MTKNISSKLGSKVSERPLQFPLPTSLEAMEDLRQSVDRFCLLAGSLQQGVRLVVAQGDDAALNRK